VTCINPEPLSDADILAFVEGEAGAEIVAHIQQCPHCATLAADYARLQHGLRQRLFRFDCPAAQRLGEFYLDLLPPEQRAEIAAHLERCVRCQDDLEALHQFMTGVPLEIAPGWLAVVRRVVARLVPPTPGFGPSLAPQPAYAGLRGPVAAGPQRYAADDLSIDLAVEDDRSQPGRRLLIGLVTRPGQDLAVLEDTPVELRQDGRSVATARVDDVGNFVLAGLLRGRYGLALLVGDTEVVVESVAV
jgi:hypothetical protein